MSVEINEDEMFVTVRGIVRKFPRPKRHTGEPDEAYAHRLRVEENRQTGFLLTSLNASRVSNADRVNAGRVGKLLRAVRQRSG